MKVEFLSTDFENYSNIRRNENPLSGSLVVPCGQTDRHYEVIVTSRNFCERA